MEDRSVAIVMGTYCGEKFVEEQLNSLYNQTYSNFTLYIRDDASTDSTPALLRGDHIELGTTNLGVKENFFSLLQKVKESYVFFSDQDDVWKPTKIEKTLKKMAEMETLYGKEMPLLVHTDLEVVDEKLNPIASSFWKYMGLKPKEGQTLKSLLRKEVVTGCTMLVNRPLIEKAFPVSKEAPLHDSWLAIVAATYGKIGLVKEATLLYRQHANNVIGAKRPSFFRRFF